MSREISLYFPNTVNVEEFENNDGNTVLDLGQTPEDFTTVTGDYSLNASNNLVIDNSDLANSVAVGDTIQIDVDGVITEVVVSEVDSAAGTVTIDGDQTTLDSQIAAGTTVAASTVFEQAVFEGVSTGLSIQNANGVTNPLALVDLVTMTVDQYEAAFPNIGGAGAQPDETTLYLLTEDPITT